MLAVDSADGRVAPGGMLTADEASTVAVSKRAGRHAAALTHTDDDDDDSLTLAEACQTRTLLLLASGNALAWGVGSGIFFNLSSIVVDAGLPATSLAPCLYVPWAICRSTGQALAGYLLDALPPRLLLSAGLLLASCGILVLSSPGGATLTPTLAMLFGVLHGFGNGATSLTFRAAPAIFFGRRHLGAIGGLLSMLNLGSTAVGPLLVGASYDLLGSYVVCLRAIALCTGLFAFLCLGMHAPPRPTRARATSKPTSGPVPSAAEETGNQSTPGVSGQLLDRSAGRRGGEKKTKPSKRYAKLAGPEE